MLPDNFIKLIMHAVKEVFIGGNYFTVWRKLDHRHGTADRIDHALILPFFVHGRADIGSHFYDACDVFVGADDGHVAGLQPDLSTCLVQA